MALPNVDRQALIEACGTWDRTRRADYNFGQNRYALQVEGQLYPPKEVVSLATGRGVDTFSGGRAGANRYLAVRGFTVIDLAEVGARQLGLVS